MAHLLFLDIETRRTDVEVGGWDNVADMGVSVVVTFNSGDDRFHVYEEQDLPFLFEELFAADLVVGYNVRNFDYRVLSRYATRPLDGVPTLDLADAIAKASGHRVKLDNLAKTTLNSGKGGAGSEAPLLFRDGLMYELVEYCVQDVRITRDLYRHGVAHGSVAFKETDGTRREIIVGWGRDGD